MGSSISRRDFLRLSGLALTGLAFSKPHLADSIVTPVIPPMQDQDQGRIARVTVKEIDLRSEPRDDAPIIGKRYRDQIVHLYYDLIPPDAPKFYNPLWYRVWGGYLHSKWLQIVSEQLNDPLTTVPESGVLCEVSVPFTTAYHYTTWDGWQPWRGSRLYYSSTHWVTGISPGPDREPWYQITSELSAGEVYFVQAAHLRPVPPAEMAPISPEVAPDKKRIEVSLGQQRLYAYEDDQLVFTTLVSSGIPSSRLSSDQFPTATPRGNFNIYSKMPSKHMGSVAYGPEIDEGLGFSLPGVPWTSFFEFPGGYAFHGTYWHNNFGVQMSHGCVNMRNEDAKWLFRWATPAFESKIESQGDWEQTGNGTQVRIHA